MPASPPAELARAAPVFSALGDATRLALLDRLSSAGALSITRLAEDSPLTRQAITKHLHVLADAGLVRDARRGREHLWRLDRERLDQARLALDRFSRQWDDALARLRTFVEEPPGETG